MAQQCPHQSSYSFFVSTKKTYHLDRSAYRLRNVIERFFCRFKNWRCIATRYDRLAINYLAAIALVSLIIAWI
ncbi:transposase [Pseudochrobactrum sp. HB0163]|uniref:transposase n=1 Tax=Pseudochrobactrum sp. HB0163 TaxID=3450708 RepID=UPI003F6DEFDB